MATNPSVIHLSALNGSDGFRISGEAAEDENGISVAGAGDINGDGFDDMITGSPLADPNGDQTGASYVIFGRARGFSATFDLSALDGSNGFKISGEAVKD